MEVSSMGILSSLGDVRAMSDHHRLPQLDLQGIARRLEALRATFNLNKAQFAESFGVDASSYSKIVQGLKPLKADMAYCIAERWSVTMDFLYRGDMSKMDETMRAKYMAALNNLDA